jgi:hypothetical protein
MQLAKTTPPVSRLWCGECGFERTTPACTAANRRYPAHGKTTLNGTRSQHRCGGAGSPVLAGRC